MRPPNSPNICNKQAKNPPPSHMHQRAPAAVQHPDEALLSSQQQQGVLPPPYPSHMHQRPPAAVQHPDEALLPSQQQQGGAAAEVNAPLAHEK